MLHKTAAEQFANLRKRLSEAEQTQIQAYRLIGYHEVIDIHRLIDITKIETIDTSIPINMILRIFIHTDKEIFNKLKRDANSIQDAENILKRSPSKVHVIEKNTEAGKAVRSADFFKFNNITYLSKASLDKSSLWHGYG